MSAPLSGTVRQTVQAELEERLGRRADIRGTRPAGGGCIHNALILDTTAGPFFLKWNRGDAGAAFQAESRGLAALRRGSRAAGLLTVPEVIAARDAEGEEEGFLVLEFLPPSAPGPAYDIRLGAGLAALHGAGWGAVFGWEEDNRIGSLAQPNPWTPTWAAFWREARLRPQLDAAFREGRLTPADREWAGPVLDAVEPALAPVAQATPALLHGDLWSGNVHAGPNGGPVLVDPAVYLGHGEVDLAMAELFGGFRRETFTAYAEAAPSPPGYADVRRPLYQLYYLLAHVRLFGGGYLSGTRNAARAVLRAVG